MTLAHTPVRRDARGTTYRYDVHDLAVEVACDVPSLDCTLRRALGAFTELHSHAPAERRPTVGTIEKYDADEVVRHLSPAARRLSFPTGLPATSEVYEEGERFWVVNEGWGLSEINLLRGQWKSWVLPHARADAGACVEGAVVWPMAQLLRGKGLHLVPAASVVRDGWGVLLICPFGLESELRALVRAGFKVVGQRWTALRESHDGGVEMLAMPGGMRREGRLRGDPRSGTSGWVDLLQEYCGAGAASAPCSVTLVVGSGRRAEATVEDVPPIAAAAVLRTAWPICELHPVRRQGVMAGRLSRASRLCEARLSRDAGGIVGMLTRLRDTPVKRVTVTVTDAVKTWGRRGATASLLGVNV